MNGPNPPDSTPPAAHGPDPLADAVLRSLTRYTAGYECVHPGRSLLAAVLTLGLGPMLRWPRRFAHFARNHQQQLWHLAEWLRLRSPYPAAGPLLDQARRIRFRRCLVALAWLAAAGVVTAFVVGLWRGALPPARAVLAATYGFLYHWPLPNHLPPPRRLFAAWSAGLSVGYLAHWLQVHRHAADVRRFIEQFNELAPQAGVMRVVPEMAGHGVNVKWAAVAAVLLAAGGAWALPMMWAGAAHQRYRDRSGPRNRAALAERFREILLATRPPLEVPELAGLRRLCPREGCFARLPRDARFCPRCGKAVPAG